MIEKIRIRDTHPGSATLVFLIANGSRIHQTRKNFVPSGQCSAVKVFHFKCLIRLKVSVADPNKNPDHDP